jgi:antirestriction protein ArdC
MSTQQIRETITGTIVEHLKTSDVAPWRRPWSLDRNAGSPTNVVSKKPYKGINPLLLAVSSMRHGLQGKWWATFNQWKKLGGSVMRRPSDVPRGQWGTNIVFWSPITKKGNADNGDEQESRYFLLKTYTVFCIDQVSASHLDHLRVGHEDAKLNSNEVEQRFAAADAAIEATDADIRHGGNQAYYSLNDDYVQLPFRHQFAVPEYYETACHELTHWTEHESRLNCDRSIPDNSYAFMELRAELGGCFVAAELGLPTAERLENHASYLKSWLKDMENDPKYIFRAAAQAAKAADYILAYSRDNSEELEVAATV